MVCITAKAKWKRLTILRATFNPRDRWTFQIDDHLKPPAVAKRCIFRDSLNAPRCGVFRPGGGALATTSLYPSTKIERPQRTRNGTPRRRSSFGIECSGWPGSPRHGCPRQPPPHTRPNTAEIPVPGAACPASALKPAHRVHTAATAVSSCLSASCLSTPDAHGAKWVRASARKRRLAAACGKPNALLAPPVGG